MDQTKYIKGFNHGYVLAHEDPSLLKSILDQNKSAQSDYVLGLGKGSNQHQIEKGTLQKEKTLKDKLKEIYKGQGRDSGAQERNIGIFVDKQKNNGRER